MSITICDYREFTQVRKCMKWAKVAVLVAVPFGMRIGPHGETPIYQQVPSYRCPDHTGVGLRGKVLATAELHPEIHPERKV